MADLYPYSQQLLATAYRSFSIQTCLAEMEEALKKSRRDNEALKQQTSNFSPDPDGPSDDPMEILRDCLQIHTFDVLGRGEFGHVYKVFQPLLKAGAHQTPRTPTIRS